MNASVHQLALPSFSVSGRSVLDVGCADGSTLSHPFYAVASERHGIDVDAEAIGRGVYQSPSVTLTVAGAEALPFPDERFDVVISKVSLLYTDLTKSYAEAFRVLKPGGDLFLTMHDWRHQVFHFRNAIKAKAPKRIVDHVYILGASLSYIATGYIPPRPWNGTRETFQSKGSLRRDLAIVGFTGLKFERTARDFIVHAHKP